MHAYRFKVLYYNPHSIPLIHNNNIYLFIYLFTARILRTQIWDRTCGEILGTLR